MNFICLKEKIYVEKKPFEFIIFGSPLFFHKPFYSVHRITLDFLIVLMNEEIEIYINHSIINHSFYYIYLGHDAQNIIINKQRYHLI